MNYLLILCIFLELFSKKIEASKRKIILACIEPKIYQPNILTFQTTTDTKNIKEHKLHSVKRFSCRKCFKRPITMLHHKQFIFIDNCQLVLQFESLIFNWYQLLQNTFGCELLKLFRIHVNREWLRKRWISLKQ